MQRLLRLPAQASALSAPRQFAPRQARTVAPLFRLAITTSAPKKAEKSSSESKQAYSGSSSSSSSSSEAPSAEPDLAANDEAKGVTGGGEPLKGTKNAPPQPKILNAKVPGKGMEMTEEQKAEVDAHNRDFEKKHDRAAPAAEDQVDKGFWSGGNGSRKK